MGSRTVKNYPSPRLMDVIGATNQSPPEAIGELVANSFDARVGKNKLSISVDMRNGHIVVIDNGKGMTFSVLEKAVCIAEDMSKHIEKGESTKGHFGMGFKTSCATLGKYYEIYTRPVEEDIEYHVAFDINDYSNRPAGADAWDVVIDDSPHFDMSPLKDSKNGTAFVISQLKDQNITVSAVLNYLGEAFKSHLEHGDEICIIDSLGEHKAVPKKYSFVPGTKVIIDEVFGPNNKYRVTGWAALDLQTHNDGHYGFNIYRHEQLIETWDKSWFRAHLMTSRIIGEVNMDFLDATFYKQGIQQSEDWIVVSTYMKTFLKPLVSASQQLSRQGNINKPAEVKNVVSQLDKVYQIENTTASQHKDNEKTDNPKKEDKPSVTEKVKNIARMNSLLLAEEGEVEITYLEISDRNTKSPFDYIFVPGDDDTHAELQVVMYISHPLWNKKTDNDVIKMLAAYDAIYRMLVEKIGFDTSEALRIRNDWISQNTGV